MFEIVYVNGIISTSEAKYDTMKKAFDACAEHYNTMPFGMAVSITFTLVVASTKAV